MLEKDEIEDIFADLEDEDSPFDDFDLENDEEHVARVLVECLWRASIPPSEYLPKHLEGHTLSGKTFSYVIRGMKFRINNYEISPAGAEVVRKMLVNDYTDKLRVSVEANFTGELYFMFKWEGLDMFGDRW